MARAMMTKTQLPSTYRLGDEFRMLSTASLCSTSVEPT